MCFHLFIVLLMLNLNFATKINLDVLNNYSEFLNFGNEKLHKLDKHHLENSIFKSKIEVLGEIFKKHVDFLKVSALDIIFLVDASSSVGDHNFKSELKFIKKLLSDITVDYNHTRVAVVTFSSPSKIIKNIDGISKPSKENNKCLLLNNQLMKIDYKGGETFTLGAFQIAKEIFESSDRNSAKKVLFLITDGYSNGGDPVPLSNELKKNEITVFTIGIQNGNYKELYELSSTPGQFYSYLLDSFEEFESLARRALHVDLKSGDYVPLGFNKPCDNLCEGENCCDENALCACGTTTGHYKCVCQPGYYGSGLKNNCLPCIPGTYSDGPDLCLPCPDVHHTTTPPAFGIESCKCKIGYQPDNNGGCKDLECKKISIPEHGYIVKKKECKNLLNSACGIRCEVGYTLVGSSIRLCQENATWSGTDPTCEVKTCSQLPVPKFGSIKCFQSDLGITYNDNEKNLPVDTVCNFECDKDKMLIGSTQRTCLPLARWDGLRATCKPIKCKRLPQIKYATIEPASCMTGKQEYGKSCKIICQEGFEISGPSEKNCTGDYGNWDSKYEETTCIDVAPPELVCPKNITANTLPHKKFGQVTWIKPNATDNSELEVTVWSKPNIKVNGQYKFQIGTTPITYFAQDAFNNRKKCIFYVHIKDIEAPVIENCIDPPPFLSDDPKGANVTWDEPSIYDNSQNVTIKKSREFGFFKTGTTTVTYKASDKSGNKNICIMNITVEVSHCDPLPSPTNGHSECAEEQEKVECLITCQEGYAIPIPETIEGSTTSFVCDHTDSIWYNKDGLLYPECQITKVPKETIGEGEIDLVDDNDACKDNNELNKLEDDLKSKISNQLCIENCTIDLKSECKTEHEEEASNRILRKRNTFVELPHKNRKRNRLNIKFQVRGTYLSDTLNDTTVLKINNATIPIHKHKFICPVGFAPRKNRCVQCPKGAFYNGTSNRCQSCGFGFYNDKLAQTECIKCLPHFSTRKYHSKKSEDCKEQCPPGTHARKKKMRVSKHEPKISVERPTLKPFCKPCPIGTYQSDYGQLTCTPCPKGHTTTSVKSTNITQCVPTSEYICYTLLNACNNQGKCIASNDYEFSCECDENYIGPYCEKHLDRCSSQPCLNGGICLPQNEDYTCACQSGFSGKFCERIEEECQKDCLNGATCLESDDEDRICLCSNGFSGENCEIPVSYCTEHICENIGNCVEDIGTFRCICQKGYFGKRCHILPCDYKPCMGFSDCLNVFEENATRDSYRCVCPPGYTGNLCDKKIDFCKSSPCINGGVCTSLEAGYSCTCWSLFFGENCQFKHNTKYLLNFPSYDVNNYVRLKGFQGNVSEITACLWMQTLDNFNYGTILSYATRFNDNAFTITDYTGLVLYVNKEYVVTDVLLNDGYWHHVCVSWKSAQGIYRVIVDGSIIKNGTGLASGTSIQGGGNIIIGQEQDIIGGRFSQSESFVGNMAYIDIWSSFLSDDEVLSHFNDCTETVFGDLYPWPKMQQHVFGNIQVLNSSFCMDCDFPKPLYNGVIDVISNIALYSCYEGFELSDRAYEKGRKCTKVSKWEGANYDPYCKKVYCGYPGYVKNAYSVGNKYYFQDTITFECLEGYTMVGESTVSCNADGKWFPDIPKCNGIQCSAFAKPKYSDLKIFSETAYDEFIENKTKFDTGTQVEVICRENTQLEGNASTLTCLDNGFWDMPPPKCSPKTRPKESETKLDCSINLIPSPPNNGYILVDSQQAVENGSQNYVEYKCRPGYRLVGVNISTCIIDGYWTELNASCVAITCSDPPLYKNMGFSPKTPGNKIHQFGNMLRYECEDGYELFGNNNIIRCMANGKWSRMVARCTKKSCKKPVVASETTLEGNSYLFGDKVMIVCSNAKKYELYCNESGIWEGDRDASC